LTLILKIYNPRICAIKIICFIFVNECTTMIQQDLLIDWLWK